MDTQEIQTNENGEVIGTNNDARIALLNKIGESVDDSRADELLDINEDGSLSQFVSSGEKNEEATGDGEEDEEKRALEQYQESQAAIEEKPQKIIRKINGVDTEITDELIAKAQKIGAADAFLAEAKRLRESAIQKPQESDKKVDADLASIARAIQMGSEEEAVEALQKLVPKNPSTPSVDDLFAMVDGRLELRNAVKKFSSDFPDIYGDPVLKSLAENMDNKLIASGDNRPYGERFTEIGNSLREWVSSKAPKQSNSQTTKQDRKAAAPSVPKAASGKHVAAAEDDAEESPREIIAKIAESRGTPQWMR